MHPTHGQHHPGGRTLRIVMLAPFGIRPKGTLSARMLPLARELVRRGHYVRIIAPAYLNPQDADSVRWIDGVAVEHVALPRLPEPPATLELAGRLLGATLRQHPDLVHLFKPKGYGGLAALWLRRWRPALPLLVDSDDWEGRGGWNDLAAYSRLQKLVFAWQERDLPRRATAVTVASRTLQTQMWGFGVPPARVLYLPLGVPPTPPPLPERAVARRRLGLDAAPVVLLYTRFWEYDLRDVVTVLIALAQQQPEARLLVIGAGERGEEEHLRQMAQRAGVGAALDLRGWGDAALIQAAMAAADVALMPYADTLMNRAKGMAKLLELLHAGLPVVASRVGQATEYIQHQQTGLLVAPDDGGALAGAVLQLLTDPATARRLGQAAQQDVSARFAWPRQASALEGLYDACVTRRRARSRKASTAQDS